MTGANYPSDWDTVRQEVIEQNPLCGNCQTPEEDTCLQVHHIVPIRYAGSHRKTNLVPLCDQCHGAAHGRQMAPRVRWYSNGELSNDEFRAHVDLWKQLRERFGAPRYDPEDECVYVPLADTDHLIQLIRT